MAAKGDSPAPVIVHDEYGLGAAAVFVAIDHAIWQTKVSALIKAICYSKIGYNLNLLRVRPDIHHFVGGFHLH
jgi:hypothetical protein